MLSSHIINVCNSNIKDISSLEVWISLRCALDKIVQKQNTLKEENILVPSFEIFYERDDLLVNKNYRKEKKKWQKVPSFQAFGPTPQQFQWPLKETLLKSLLQWTKVWKKYKHEFNIPQYTFTQNKAVTEHDERKGPNNHIPTNPAGLASLGGCWGVKWCWPLVTTDSQLVSLVASVVCKKTTVLSQFS